jgi:UDP-N-acetylmuramoyl-tripeptide--D-alanyl-D-alanine ligase
MEILGIDETIHACGGTPFYCSKIKYISGISTDTRKLEPGDLFVALKGVRFDGHEFASKAIALGATAVLSQVQLMDEVPYILVEDTLKALHDIAKHYRNKFHIPFASVTGSSGKTTTKDMVSSVLAEKYCVLKTEGNFNNAIGLPLTVFKLEKKHEIAVLEMGMNSLGEIEILADILRPDTGIITNVGTAHIENLGSRENILRAKTEMFTYFGPKNTAVINGDNDMLRTLIAKPYEIITYGLEPHNSCRAIDIAEKGEEGTDFTVLYQGKKESYGLSLPGIHNVYNALSAICVGKLYGLSRDEIHQGLMSFTPSKMRMEIFQGKYGAKVINDAYNANPDSMRAAVNVLAAMPCTGRRVCILGDMFELGDFAREEHYKVGSFAAQKNMDVVAVVGKQAKEIINGANLAGRNMLLYCFDSNEEVIKNLGSMIKRDDLILIKGSRGMHMETIVESLREGRSHK